MSDSPSIPTACNPAGIEFYDNGQNRMLKYVYPTTPHWTAGWLLYQHPDGHWVTLRNATEEDVEAISAAVVCAHHPRGRDG